MSLVPLIIAGGNGTRLWPLSRSAYPKQFLKLRGRHSLLQDTVLRLRGINTTAPLIVCNQQHRFLVEQQLRAVAVDAHIILEPESRNTAPAVAVAALLSREIIGADPLLLVLPADHVIEDSQGFHAAVQTAAEQALLGRLVTFGVVPTGPETGYGYIQRGEVLDGAVRSIARFVEKPDLAQARQYLQAGDYYWNSGMFLFRASRYLEELGIQAPAMAEACRQACATLRFDGGFIRLDAAAFNACPADSVDYAVLEHTEAGAVVPIDMGWNDIGAWSALQDVAGRDDDGNTLSGDVVVADTQDSYIHSAGRLVTALGMRDTVIVETADAVLVAERSRVQDIKSLVGKLSQAGRREVSEHTQVFRPWGHYETVAGGDRYQVKRITIDPGQKLSLQMHHHRAEHWIVVRGTARVVRDDEVRLLSENQSTYIPLGARHRLENPGKIPLELIEVQSGTYLGEDDIVRFEDQYGRSS
jgi:mannose-1-phosphate guanylyltransferase/mannose-6-phosphate isomerase